MWVLLLFLFYLPPFPIFLTAAFSIKLKLLYITCTALLQPTKGTRDHCLHPLPASHQEMTATVSILTFSLFPQWFYIYSQSFMDWDAWWNHQASWCCQLHTSTRVIKIKVAVVWWNLFNDRGYEIIWCKVKAWRCMNPGCSCKEGVLLHGIYMEEVAGNGCFATIPGCTFYGHDWTDRLRWDSSDAGESFD